MFVAKYELILIATRTKVSVTALYVRNLNFLNIRLVVNPNIAPVDNEMTPSMMNSPII